MQIPAALSSYKLPLGVRGLIALMQKVSIISLRLEKLERKHGLLRYVSSLKGRKSVVIDIDSTDDPIHGNQQLSMFNGYAHFKKTTNISTGKSNIPQ